MVQKVIETGVDKLMSLVQQNKEISMQDASLKLGVSLEVVRQWAYSMEEEGTLTIQYRLAKEYLVLRTSTKEETTKREQSFIKEKNLFLENVQGTLQSIENEITNIQKLKEQYNQLRDTLNFDLADLQKDFETIRKYQEEERLVNKELLTNHEEFLTKIQAIEKQIGLEKENFEQVASKMKEQTTQVSVLKQNLDKIRVEESYLKDALERLSLLKDEPLSSMTSFSDTNAKQKNT
ncbi:hypothetical protein HYW21_03560 [Candidatus Woesearchaeota archaeon]|nr:hypothetical protein [Candidatus Woesearchaeota archaeon]